MVGKSSCWVGSNDNITTICCNSRCCAKSVTFNPHDLHDVGLIISPILQVKKWGQATQFGQAAIAR